MMHCIEKHGRAMRLAHRLDSRGIRHDNQCGYCPMAKGHERRGYQHRAGGLTWARNVIDPLARRAIGKTALRVSRLGVGGGSTFGRAVDGTSLLDTCWDAGLRYFDSAPLYGAGESERRFGAFLASKSRETFVLSTQVGRIGPTQLDYSADAIPRALRGSHERLGLSRIDLVFINDLDPDLLGDAFERQFDQAVNE